MISVVMSTGSLIQGVEDGGGGEGIFMTTLLRPSMPVMLSTPVLIRKTENTQQDSAHEVNHYHENLGLHQGLMRFLQSQEIISHLLKEIKFHQYINKSHNITSNKAASPNISCLCTGQEVR